MNPRHDTVLAWSGGKDAAFALLAPPREPEALLTTYDERTGRLPHTGVPLDLVRAQARLLGLPLIEVPTPDPWDDDVYGSRMGRALTVLRPGGAVLFGDLYLAELRAAREQALARGGHVGGFPAWTEDTRARAGEIVGAGIEAVVTSIDLRVLDRDLLGRPYDSAFLADLPPGVDPCGERGEFQTFVTGHPRFTAPLAVRPGDRSVDGDFATQQLLAG